MRIWSTGSNAPVSSTHGNVRQPRRLLDKRGNLVPALAGHADVGEDDVGRRGLEAVDGLVAVADGNHLDVFLGEGQLDDALDRDAVVSQQKSMRHLVSIGRTLATM